MGWWEDAQSTVSNVVNTVTGNNNSNNQNGNSGYNFLSGVADILNPFSATNPITSGIGNMGRWGERQVGNVFDRNNPFNLLNLQTNWSTMGLAGFDGRGFNPQAGALTNFADESIGEVTGRNMQREALYQAGQMMLAEDARRARLLADERLAQAEADRAASNSAAGSRRGTSNFGGSSLSMQDQTFGDLLGR